MCAIERSNPKAGVGQILELYLEHFSSYVHFSKQTQNLNMGVKTKSELTLIYIKSLFCGWGCMLLKGLTLK